MDITAWAYHKRRFVLVTIMMFMIAGISVYRTIPKSEDPGYVVRTAKVTTFMPGASPERMEELVTNTLEKVIQEMPEIDYLKSESKTGVSIIYVNILESYTNMRPIWDSLRRKVETGARKLPSNAGTPIVDDEFGDVFGITFSIIGDGFSYREVKEIADDVRDLALQIHEVAKVNIFGAQAERVFIEYDDAKLSQVGLSPDQLAQILSRRNIINSGGQISTDKERLILEPTGNFESVDALRRTLIPIPGTDQVVALSDITHIERSYIDPPKSIMHTNGMTSLGMAISMRKGGNIIVLGEKVEALLGSLKAAYPIGIEFEISHIQSEVVTKKISDFVSNLLQAIVIVCLVMLCFLGLRTGLVVASLIPVAIILTVLVMPTLGIGLDQVSLAALIIALGMLVDNSIVMSESVMVQMERGKKAVDAAIDASQELRVPLLISSLTTAAAFLPIYLAESQTGEYCAAIFEVVTTTLLISWLVSITMIPILCILFIRVKKKPKVKDPYKKSRFYTLYRRVLTLMLRWRLSTVGLAALALVLNLVGLGYVPKIFFPPSDDPKFSMAIELPIGVPIERTEGVITEIDQFIARELTVNEERSEGIESWVSYIGNGGPRFRLQHSPEPPNSHYSFTLFNATSMQAVEEAIEKLNQFVFERFPDVKAKIAKLQMGSPIDNPIEVRILGKDEDTLFALTDRIKEKLDTIDGTRNVQDNWGLRTKKLVVAVDEERAQRAKVTNASVARALESAFSGIQLSEYREDDEIIPIVLRSIVAKNPQLIGTEPFNVFSEQTGRFVPVQQVADLNVEWQPSQILRRDRLKAVTTMAALAPGMTAKEVTDQLLPWLEKESKSWPIGYRYEVGGEKDKSGRASKSVSDKLPVAGFIILLLLLGQFNSIRRTAIILLTIPLAMIGVTAGLLIAGSYFGFMTLLGIISLAGIVINNAIVLLDRINIEEQENGLSPQDAIVMAAQARLRPILLTTITTVSGLLPLWMGGGAMWEPMAIAIIFGLVVATVLTLGIVPVLYSLFFRVRF